MTHREKDQVKGDWQEAVQSQDFLDENALIEHLFEEYRTTTTPSDLNALEYFGLAWPAIKTIARDLRGIEDAAKNPPAAEIVVPRIFPDDCTPGFVHLGPGDELYWTALLAPREGSLAAECTLGRWIEDANTALAGKWTHHGNHARWTPAGAERVTRRSYWRFDAGRIADLLRRSTIQFNALTADRTFFRSIVEKRLAEIRDEVSCPSWGHAGLRFYLTYLRLGGRTRGDVWAQIGELPAVPWLEELGQDLVGADRKPSTKAKNIIGRFREILQLQMVQLHYELGVKEPLPQHHAINMLCRAWHTTQRVMESELEFVASQNTLKRSLAGE